MKKLLILILGLFLSPLVSSASIIKEDTAREISVWFFDASTGAPKTGITVTNVTCRYTKNDMTSASFSPTVAGGGTNDMAEIGNGQYKLELTAAQLDTAGLFDIGCSISGSTSPPTQFDIYTDGAYAVTIGGSPASISDILNSACTTVTEADSWAYRICSYITALDSNLSPWKNPTTIATIGSQTSFTLTNGSANDNTYNGWEILVTGQASPLDQAVAVVEDYEGATKTVTLRTDPAIFTMGVGDVVQFHPSRSLKPMVDNRSLVVDANGLADATTVKVGPTGAGTAQTARDIGASVLLSSGTGTGQVKLSSGYVAPNWGDVGNPTTTVGLTNTTIGVLTTYTGNTPQTGDSFARLGAPAGASVSADIAAVKVDTAAVKVKTDFLPSATAGSAGGLFIAGVNAATSITTALTANIVGNVTGNLSGSIGSVGAGGIAAASFAANAINASKVDPDVSTEFAATLMATTYEGSETFQNFLRYGSAMLFGKYSVAGNVFSFRNLGDTKVRVAITATSSPDARTVVVLDGTD